MPLLQWNKLQCDNYIELLKIIWALSNLFADTNIPYLHYRVAENVFCRAFSADNLSRSDCTADARLGNIWYWLKTFICKNEKSLEKIAEFNSERKLYAKFENKPLDYIEKIAELRNERILSTMRIHWIESMFYHCVTRKWGAFSLHEEEMNTIDINNIRNIKKKENVITFDDKIHEYSFNISKSTLYKKFYISPIYTFDVQILEDPLELLEELYNNHKNLLVEEMPVEWSIILPLYSKTKDWEFYVPEWSGLNQRNAKWRPRNPDEIYIPIPSRIHSKFPDFFPWRDKSFNLYLPDNTILSAKICQDGWKALMSNPNKALWERLLRKILKKKEKSLVKYLDLEMMWVDAVEISKKNWEYYINFKEIWTFEEFKNNYK